MSEVIKEVKDKISEQLKSFSGGQKGKAISKSVADVLKKFCADDERFASAILESNETLSSCCKAIMSDVVYQISKYTRERRNSIFPKQRYYSKWEFALMLRKN
jgi:hypothetical protein